MAWLYRWKSRAYYTNFRQIDSATTYALRAKELYEQANDTKGKLSIYVELSSLSINDRNEPNARKYYLKAKELSTDTYDSFLVARTYGRILSHFSTPDSALTYLKKALPLMSNAEDSSAYAELEKARLLYYIGWTYTTDKINDYRKALSYFKWAKAVGDIAANSHLADYIYINTLEAYCYRKLDLLDSASAVLQQAAAAIDSFSVAGIHWHKMNVYRQWAWIEYQRENYKTSTDLLGVSRKETDLYYNERLATSATSLANSYEQKLKDQEIASLKAKDNRKNNILIASILAALLFIGLSFYAYSLYSRAKQQNQELEANRNEIQKISKNLELSLKEIHHRIKNNLQVISSLLSLQKNQLTSPEAKEALAESQNRIRAMALIHEQLYSFSEFDQVSLKEYVGKITDHIATTFKTRDQITFDINMDDTKLPLDTSVSVGMIINELATNAIKYGFPEKQKGKVSISGERTEDHYLLQISDSGVGLSPDFVLANQKGVGYQIIQALSIKLKSKLEIVDTTKAHIRLQIPIS